MLMSIPEVDEFMKIIRRRLRGSCTGIDDMNRTAQVDPGKTPSLIGEAIDLTNAVVSNNVLLQFDKALEISKVTQSAPSDHFLETMKQLKKKKSNGSIF